MTDTKTSSKDESSDDSSDKGDLENDTQDQDQDGDDKDQEDGQGDDAQDDQENQTDASDYLGSEDDNASKTEDEDDADFKKRYSDSSREAQRLAGTVKEKQAEIDEWVELVKANPELQKVVREKTGKDLGGKDLSKIENRLANIERQNQNKSIQDFEVGKDITPKLREKMKPLVSVLVGSMPLSEALDIAYLKVNPDGATKLAEESGKRKALAQSKTNKDATYTTSNSSKVGNKTYNMTQEEQDYVDNMPGNPEEKQQFIEFHYQKKKE